MMSAAQIDTQKALAVILENLSKASSEPPAFIPVTDSIYIRRLEKALVKNFDYIRRKDSGLLDNAQKKGDISASDSAKKSGGHGYPKENPSNNVRPGMGMWVATQVDNFSIPNAGSSGSVSVQAQVQTQIVESLSIYICGLPLDIDEKDLEILFSSQGSIKKVKIYTNPDGTKKGDALVTYSRAEAAAMAVIQYNNLNIGDGFVISVSRAFFNPTTSASTSSKADPDPEPSVQEKEEEDSKYRESSVNFSTSEDLSSYTNQAIPNRVRDALPPECLAASHPVALLSKVYDPSHPDCQDDPNFFGDLEADMLVECCKFGKVLRLVTPEGPLFDSLGCIAVTFESVASARECASSLHGRWFDSRQIETLVFSPPAPIFSFPSSSSSSSSSHKQSQGALESAQQDVGSSGLGSSAYVQHNGSISSATNTSAATVHIVNPAPPAQQPQVEIDLPDVDDFLNSFL